jgi:hypothetical protein
MSQENAKLVLDVISVIEHRDPQRPDPRPVLELCHPEIEFHWPPSLPYGQRGGRLIICECHGTRLERAATTALKKRWKSPLPCRSRARQAINMKAAKDLGVTIPQSLLVRADEIVQ